MDWEGIIRLPGSMKDAPEVCDHEFEVRTVSTVAFLQPRSMAYVQARRGRRLGFNQGWVFFKMSVIKRGTVESKVYAREN